MSVRSHDFAICDFIAIEIGDLRWYLRFIAIALAICLRFELRLGSDRHAMFYTKLVNPILRLDLRLELRLDLRLQVRFELRLQICDCSRLRC